MMTDNQASISYHDARNMEVVRRVKNAWKKDVSQGRVSRETLAMVPRDWRKGSHELIVDKDIIVKDWS